MFDNGKQFDNLKFKGFCAELGTKNYYSSAIQWASRGHYKDSKGNTENQTRRSKRKLGRVPLRGIIGIQNYAQVNDLGNPVRSGLWH